MTHMTLSGGGKNKDQSKSEKVNTNNIIDKVKETTVPEGAFGISEKGKIEALNNRINAASNITNIPSGEDLPEGSFGISEAGAAEALARIVLKVKLVSLPTYQKDHLVYNT